MSLQDGSRVCFDKGSMRWGEIYVAMETEIGVSGHNSRNASSPRNWMRQGKYSHLKPADETSPDKTLTLVL